MTTELFGRPISGDPQPTNEPVDQAPDQDFLLALDTLLDVPDVKEVRWAQYTPYFNDGEPCEFSIHSAYILAEGVEEDAGDYEDGYLGTYDFYEYVPGPDGKINWNGNPERKWREFPNIGGEDLQRELQKFENVLTSGGHNVLLGRTFGDHAVVTATKEGFNVEFYEHD